MADDTFHEMFPLGEDTTEYRKLTSDYVSTAEFDGEEVLVVDPEGIKLLTAQAFGDIAHYLRPEHLQQLSNILKDDEASDNDRFVALDLLKNANIASGGILPMCQDTGTAIVMGKKGQNVWVKGNDEAAAIQKNIDELSDQTDELLAKYRTVLTQIESIRIYNRQLRELMTSQEEELASLTTQGQQLEEKIEGYKKDYAELISEAQLLKTEMSKVTDKVQRSSKLLEDLLGERQRWQRQTEAFGEDLEALVGNVILSSAFLVYFGMFDQETRTALFNKLSVHLAASGIRVKDDLTLADYLCAADERCVCLAVGRDEGYRGSGL